MTVIILLTLSTILALVGPVTYISSIIRGGTRPHRVTRLVLMFVLGLNFVSVVAAHGSFGAQLFAGVLCAQAVIIFGLSLWRGMGGSSRFDWLCLIVAAAGLIGWQVTGNPVLGIVFSVIADLAAYVPAFVKTWAYPQTESPGLYVAGGLSAGLSLAAYHITTASVFQFYIILSCLIMLVCIYHARLRRFMLR